MPKNDGYLSRECRGGWSVELPNGEMSPPMPPMHVSCSRPIVCYCECHGDRITISISRDGMRAIRFAMQIIETRNGGTWERIVNSLDSFSSYLEAHLEAVQAKVDER